MHAYRIYVQIAKNPTTQSPYGMHAYTIYVQIAKNQESYTIYVQVTKIMHNGR